MHLYGTNRLIGRRNGIQPGFDWKLTTGPNDRGESHPQRLAFATALHSPDAP